MRSSKPFGTCAYCGKRIMWVRTKAGKNMPVDPTLISFRRPKAGEKDKERIVTQTGEVVAAEKADNAVAEGIGYISHFATCTGRKHK